MLLPFQRFLFFHYSLHVSNKATHCVVVRTQGGTYYIPHHFFLQSKMTNPSYLESRAHISISYSCRTRNNSNSIPPSFPNTRTHAVCKCGLSLQEMPPRNLRAQVPAPLVLGTQVANEFIMELFVIIVCTRGVVVQLVHFDVGRVRFFLLNGIQNFLPCIQRRVLVDCYQFLAPKTMHNRC